MEPKSGSRKIQESASGSFYVTLPRSWVKRNEIRKGDTVDLVCYGVDLQLFPQKRPIRKDLEKSLDMDKYSTNSLMERAITNCYIQGYDVINIVYDKVILRDLKNWIREAVLPKLLGTISEELPDKVKIRVLIDPARYPINEVINRMFDLVYSMHKDAIRSITKCDLGLADDVKDRTIEVDRLYRLMLRQIMLSIERREGADVMCMSKKECFIGAITARDINRMAFYAVDLAEQTRPLCKENIDDSIMNRLFKLSNLAMEMQENAIYAFFKNDFILANNIMDKIDSVRDLNHDIDEEISKKVSNPKSAVALTTVSRDIRRIASYAVAIADNIQTKSILD